MIGFERQAMLLQAGNGESARRQNSGRFRDDETMASEMESLNPGAGFKELDKGGNEVLYDAPVNRAVLGWVKLMKQLLIVWHWNDSE